MQKNLKQIHIKTEKLMIFFKYIKKNIFFNKTVTHTYKKNSHNIINVK